MVVPVKKNQRFLVYHNKESIKKFTGERQKLESIIIIYFLWAETSKVYNGKLTEICSK